MTASLRTAPDDLDTRPQPKVSVCVVTYNQEDYIAQCLQSLVDQVVDFPFEIIVSDDCSTDSTSDVVAGFATRYPDLVRHVRQARNIGAFRNFNLVHGLARSPYIAHVDGDDYALPGKLQRQADFLDRHPDCQILWHRMLLLDAASGRLEPQIYEDVQMRGRQFTTDDLLCNITIGLHSSKMYRRWERPEIEGPDSVDFSENMLHLHAVKGYATFLDSQALGVYRTSNGISRSAWRIRIKIYRWMKYFFAHGIGDRNMICSKLSLMVASDLKHASRSFWVGLSVLAPMLLRVWPTRALECRARRLMLS